MAPSTYRISNHILVNLLVRENIFRLQKYSNTLAYYDKSNIYPQHRIWHTYNADEIKHNTSAVYL